MSAMQTNSRQQLKEKICRTALRMFHQRGIRQVKMDDIAAALTISKRTLYELYTNKMELLGEVLELQYNMSHERLEREQKPGANTMDILILALKISIEELNELSMEFLDDLHRFPEARKKLDELEARRDDQMYDFLQQGVREGYFLPNANFRLLDDIVRVLRDHTHFYQKYGAREVWRTLVRVFLRSICTLKAIEELDIFLEKMDGQQEQYPSANITLS